MSRPAGAAVACLAAALAAPAAAGTFATGANTGFVARSFALPELGATRAAAGAGETTVSIDVANEFVQEGDCAAECIVLDGETTRLRLTHQRSLGAGWDVALSVPLLDQDGGVFDGWIQDWHGWFGLSNGGREFVADDRHRYRYVSGGVTRFDETRGASGLGDTDVTLGRSLGAFVAARALARLPTADHRLLGGGEGGAVWLELRSPAGAAWAGYLAAGASLNESGDLWGGREARAMAFAGAGLAVPLFGPVQLATQVHAHGAALDDSAVSPLFRPGIPLTMVARVALGRGLSFDLGFQEDLSVNASPDLTLLAHLGYR